jgi:hypothetical protein
MAMADPGDEMFTINAYVTLVRAIGLHPKLSEHSRMSP